MMKTKFLNDRQNFKLYELEDGSITYQKEEDMTHLQGNILVLKTHPIIAFRGKMDSLLAKILEVQLIAKTENNAEAYGFLEELADFARKILIVEVLNKELDTKLLMGYTEEQLREISHHPMDHLGINHFFVNVDMGPLIIALNRLRTMVRETELACLHAFSDQSRSDLVKALNRFSSAVYILTLNTYKEQLSASL